LHKQRISSASRHTVTLFPSAVPPFHCVYNPNYRCSALHCTANLKMCSTLRRTVTLLQLTTPSLHRIQRDYQLFCRPVVFTAPPYYPTTRMCNPIEFCTRPTSSFQNCSHFPLGLRYFFSHFSRPCATDPCHHSTHQIPLDAIATLLFLYHVHFISAVSFTPPPPCACPTAYRSF
jgi:hypothetical protein